MKMIKIAVAAVALSLALGGCAQLQQWTQGIKDAYTAVSQAKVSYKYALAGVATFNSLEDAGRVYLSLPTCTASSGPVCHDRHATRQIGAAFQAGRIARDAVLGYIKSNPCSATSCPLMPQGVYKGLSGVIDTLRAVYTQYNVSMGG